MGNFKRLIWKSCLNVEIMVTIFKPPKSRTTSKIIYIMIEKAISCRLVNSYKTTFSLKVLTLYRADRNSELSLWCAAQKVNSPAKQRI